MNKFKEEMEIKSNSLIDQTSCQDNERKVETVEEKALEVPGKSESDKNEILKFTMLINKYNSDLGMKRNWKNGDDQEGYKKDVKCTMFFNKEVTIRSNQDVPSSLTVKSLEPVKMFDKDSKQLNSLKINRLKSNPKFDLDKPVETPFRNLHMIEPEIFSEACSSSSLEYNDRKSKGIKNKEAENLKKFLNRPSKIENDFIQSNFSSNLRTHNSLTSLSKNLKLGLKGVLKSKIPSLTAIETNSVAQKSGLTKFSYWDHWNNLAPISNDVDKRLNFQITKTNNDNGRRSLLKYKKEDAASVSDSKLLYTNSETKKQIKKNDKKSRGDSSKKEKDSGGKKQVQWKTEVDVIYFSSHQGANGDRMGEVIGRVMEPLREEWEQQRKGFYAKLVPYHMEVHLKDHFISLLKI